MSYFVRKVTKREVLKGFAGKDESFGNAFAEYLNSQKAPVVAFAFEGSEITIVFQSDPKKASKD